MCKHRRSRGPSCFQWSPASCNLLPPPCLVCPPFLRTFGIQPCCPLLPPTACLPPVPQESLTKVLLFDNLDRGVQRKVVKEMYERRIGAGEILIQEGDTGAGRGPGASGIASAVAESWGSRLRVRCGWDLGVAGLGDRQEQAGGEGCRCMLAAEAEAAVLLLAESRRQALDGCKASAGAVPRCMLCQAAS